MPKAPPVTLQTLIKHGFLKVGQKYQWIYARERSEYDGKILQTGKIASEAFPLPLSPSAFCEAIARALERKGKISGHEEGLVNGVSLVKIANRYRKKMGFPLCKSGRNSSSAQIELKEEPEAEQRMTISDRVIVDIHQDLGKVLKVTSATQRSIDVLQTDVQLQDTKITRVESGLQNMQVKFDTMIGGKDQEISELYKELGKVKTEVIMLRSKPVLVELPADKIKADTYPVGKKSKETSKNNHNEMFTDRILAELKSCREGTVYHLLILDGSDARTYTTINDALKKGGLQKRIEIHVPNCSDSSVKLKNKKIDSDDTALNVKSCTLEKFLSSREALQHTPFLGAWLDINGDFANLLHDFESLIRNQNLHQSSIIALTWGNSRRPDAGKTHNDIDKNLQEIKRLAKELNLDIEESHGPEKYGPKDAQRFFIARFVQHQDKPKISPAAAPSKMPPKSKSKVSVTPLKIVKALVSTQKKRPIVEKQKTKFKKQKFCE